MYALQNAPGRVYAVPRTVAVPGDADAASVMTFPDFHATEVAIVEDSSAEGQWPASRGVRTRWLRDEYERVTADR